MTLPSRALLHGCASNFEQRDTHMRIFFFYYFNKIALTLQGATIFLCASLDIDGK